MTQLHPLTLPIIQEIATTKEAASLTESINSFLADLYKMDQRGIKELIQSHFPKQIADILIEQMLSGNIHLTSHQEVETFFSILNRDLSSCRTLMLTIAFLPTARITRRIAEAVKQKFGIDVICEIITNPDIVGGAIIVFGGRYINASLKKQLDILFEVKREEIMKILYK